MGNSSSSSFFSSEQEEERDDRFDGIDTLGYRVLGVQPGSPASQAGLVSFFDFLVGCDGQMLLRTTSNNNNNNDNNDNDNNGNDENEEEKNHLVDFPALLQNSIGKDLEMLVWNIKSQDQRLIKIKPSSSWGGTGLLGVTIRLDNYYEADERLIRILSIEPNSPSSIAGLLPLTDYLLGTTTQSFDSYQTLISILTYHVDTVMEIYVYNTQSDIVRVVALMPTLSWCRDVDDGDDDGDGRGSGLLGAEIGMGYLHRLPRACRKTLGSSVERRVRTEILPTRPDLSVDNTLDLMMRGISVNSGGEGGGGRSEQDHHPPFPEEGGGREEELVDLVALTESVKGMKIHLEPPSMEEEIKPNANEKEEGNIYVEHTMDLGRLEQTTIMSEEPISQISSSYPVAATTTTTTTQVSSSTSALI